MRRSPAPYAIALLGVAATAWLTALFLPAIGTASAALLFLLPVLYAATRGGLLPGLLAALGGAVAYNFFLLPPRFTFRIHGLDNFVSVLVFVAVALVTSRLATLLRAREAEALGRAAASEELAALSALLAATHPEAALENSVSWLNDRYGRAVLVNNAALPAGDAGFSSLDLAAATWALHNGDVTGHGTDVMPAADWTFMPLAPRRFENPRIVAVARPLSGSTRSEAELAQLEQLAALLGQASDRAALEEQSRERDRLIQAEQLRRTFLASLAHDFHTPLTVITGRLAALSENVAEAGEALEAARRLERMLDDLLGAARIEDGSLAPRMENVDLVDVVASATECLHTPETITLNRCVSPDLPFVRADPVLLRHVLVNLLDNAGRYTAQSITVAANLKDRRVLLSVCDDGPGVPEAIRKRIFERFTRLEGGDRKHGSGLGLSIVKGFCEAMGIGIEVSDAPQGGACFELSFVPVDPEVLESEG